MIITRREDKEAADVDPKVPPLRVSHLKEEESNELFRRKVFGSKNQFCHKVFSNASCSATDEEQMEKVCKDVYEITQGLPLAIVVLAGLLRTKYFTERDKLLTNLKSNEETKRVKRILALCFDDLPSRLKSCFLYFAGMLENVILKARRLVRLWAAEGFLKAKKGKTMEDVGQGYLKELIARGMIHLVKQDSNGGIWLIAIHDRLHAFSQSEAQEESFLEVHDNAEILAPVSVRRLYLQNYVQSYVPMETSFPKLRSVLCHFAEETRRYSEEPPQHTNGDTFRNQNTNNNLRHHAFHFLPRSNFLRVVDLRGLRVKKVPKAIGNLIHVRYLCLRSRSLATLPSSIRNLINLQTLDIKRTEVVDIAQEFWQVTTLRYILAEKLRLPKSVGVLNNMQTLDGVVCSDPWDNICPLHKMINLRYLAISGVTSQHRIALSDAFMKLESLIYLQIIGDEIQFDIFTRFILRRLQILELYGKITISSSKKEERYTLPNLTRLVLKSSQVNQSFINKIGELPSLTELVLSEESYHGEELIFSESGFRSLTSMVLKDLAKLSTLKMRSNSIARVKKITVSGCSKMVIKPDGEHENLKEIVVSNMPENWKMEATTALHAKINRVPIITKREDMMDAIQRDGKWRAGIVAADLYQL